jgi:hypothetical protein
VEMDADEFFSSNNGELPNVYHDPLAFLDRI